MAGQLFYDQVSLLLTDPACYMIKASQNLRHGLCPEISHMRCICRALSRVCEENKLQHLTVDRLITSLKCVLSRCQRRASALGRISGRKVMSVPVATRWGT